MDNVELLKAKDAIFRLIGRYCICFLGTNNNYYMSDYFDCAIERSFDVLGFDRDEVPLMEFCQAWEDNNRKLWLSICLTKNIEVQLLEIITILLSKAIKDGLIVITIEKKYYS